MTYVEREIAGKTVRIENFLMQKLDHLHTRIKRDNDNIIMIDGMEGTGKSTGLAFPIGWYLSGGPFEVVFTPQQFREAFDKAKKGGTIVWDEFVLAGLSTQALSQMQQVIIKKLTTGRKKNLNIVLVVPNYFMFRDYFSCHRSLFLLNTYSPDFLSRGYYRYYDYHGKQIMYHKNKKVKIHSPKYAQHKGNFCKTSPGYYIDEEYYQSKKDEAIQQIGDEEEEKDKPTNKHDLKWRTAWMEDHKDDILSMNINELQENFPNIKISGRQWSTIKKEIRANE